MTSLGLAPRRRRAEDEPDEREVGVRNAAYFAAYRVLAWYSIIMWFAILLTLDLRASATVKGQELFTIPLVAMALTLPQALVLWTEPDVPEESRV